MPYSQTFIDECNLNGIYKIFMAPYTSDQCQPLDLVTFALLISENIINSHLINLNQCNQIKLWKC